jgi:hypothetical protein
MIIKTSLQSKIEVVVLSLNNWSAAFGLLRHSVRLPSPETIA